MEAGAGCRRDLATDVLVDILLRLPPNARRRLRLVSRRWRDVVDASTATGLKSRAKTLVVTMESAYILDNLPAGRCTELSLSTNGSNLYCRHQSIRVVGTCNGLICLCDDSKPGGGALTFANPVTGEKLAIPPLPARYTDSNRCWHMTYRIMYDQTTGRYRVVHIPSRFDRVVVFVLGQASWVDVAMPAGSRCEGMVTVDGTMYWPVKGEEAKFIMSFDLESERLTPIESLPSVLSRSRPGTWDLSEVHGRLGIAFTHVSAKLDRTDVWVMEGQERWSQWYSVQTQLTRNIPRLQHLVLPHFAHGNDEHVLTRGWSYAVGGYVLYGHKPSNDTRKARRGVVEISDRKRGAPVADVKSESSIFRVFAHVETTEALSVYKCW